jgi:eukaryotic-like serine/threonine-protein kinase
MSGIKPGAEADFAPARSRDEDNFERGPLADELDRLASQFVASYRNGEKVDVGEIADQNPELAEQIRDLFPALLMMERVRPAPDEFQVYGSSEVSETESKLESLGDFRILREVGRGGMGIVYEAEQTSLGRHVALKVLPSHALLDTRYVKRFQNEARAAARLHHTNIVPVFGVGQQDGIHYYIMQFIQGVALDEVLNELRVLRGQPSRPNNGRATATSPDNGLTAAYVAQSLASGDSGVAALFNGGEAGDAPSAPKSPPGRQASAAPNSGSNSRDVMSASFSGTSPRFDQRHREFWKGVARIGAQVADALAYAHQHSVLHRDIKPANLLLDGQGTVWVTDFGLARNDESQGLTRTGDIVGTMRYMAPEQLEGKSDARSDIYSLGVTLYELLTLTTPNNADDRARLVRQILDSTPRRPRAIDPKIPVDLETIVLKAISRYPADRYQNGAELAADLRRFLDDRPIEARRIAASERAIRWCRRNPVIAALGAIVLVLCAGLLIIAGVSRAMRHERDMEFAARQMAEKAESRAKQLLTRAESAERDSKILAHLAKANSLARSRAVGQRTLALEEIRKAANLNPTAEQADTLRNAALAAFVLPDVKLLRSSPPFGAYVSKWADPDVKRYAAIDWGDTRSAVVYDAITNEEIVQFPVPERNIWFATVDFTPDGRFLIITYSVSGDPFKFLQVWDITKRSLVLEQPVNCHNVSRSSIGVHPDSRTLVIPEKNRELSVWDLQENRRTKKIKIGFVPYSIRFDRSGRRMVVSPGMAETSPQLFDIESGTPAIDFELPVSSGDLAISPGGRLMAYCPSETSATGKIAVWDLLENRLVSVLEGHENGITRLYFLGRDDHLASASWDGTTRVWNVRSGECLLVMSGVISNDPASGLFAIDKLRLETHQILPMGGQDILHVPEAGNRSLAALLGPAIQFSKTGELVFASDMNGVHIWDVGSRTVAGSLPIGITHDILTNDSGNAIITSGDIGVLRWPLRRTEGIDSVDWQIGPPVRLNPPGSMYQRCVAWIPGQQQIAVYVNDTNLIKIIDADPDDGVVRPEFTLLSDHRRIRGLAVSPDGKWIAASGWYENFVQVWSLENRSLVARIPHSDGSGNTFFQVHFSPDGRWLVCGAQNTFAPGIYVHETGTWKRHHMIRELCDVNVGFSNDSQLSVWHSIEGKQLVIADTESGRELARLPLPYDAFTQLIFSPDGASLLYRRDRYSIGIVHLGRLQGMLKEFGLPWNFSLPTGQVAPDMPDRIRADCGAIPEELLTNANARKSRELTIAAAEDTEAEDFLAAIDKYQRALDLTPENPLILNNLAWLLVSSPDSAIRDPKRAQELATKAIALDPNSSVFLNTLGVVQYRSGQWREAIASLQRSEEADPDRYFAYNGFFIAMAHHQLGESEMAREWYRKSIQWMDAGHAGDQELARFRKEAAGLLEEKSNDQTCNQD